MDDLYERIVDRPLTVLFGQSGLGKSSLVQAALVPRLREKSFLPVLVRFDHDPAAPSLERQLLYDLGDALAAAGDPRQFGVLDAARADESAQLDDAARLWLLFHDPSLGFIPPPGEPANGYPRPVFLIDQFEEIFTLGERPERRAASGAFRDSLAALVENSPPSRLRAQIESDRVLARRLDYRVHRERVLLSLREDFLHLLERSKRIMPSLMENRLELRMLNGPQALLAAVQPGELRPGMSPIVSDDVGRAIVRFVAGAADADVPLEEIDAVPPLLSLVCAELNARRSAAGAEQITQAQFEGRGADILRDFYLRSFAAATYGSELDGIPHPQAALNRLRRLVEDRLLSADGFRESIALDTIVRDLGVEAQNAMLVVERVVARRLLTIEERGGVRRIELAHDVLTPVVAASRDERHEAEAVARMQAEQEQALATSRAEKERAEAEAARLTKERNRARRMAVVAMCLAAIAVAGAAVGWYEYNLARHAQAEQAKWLVETLRIADINRVPSLVAALEPSRELANGLLKDGFQRAKDRSNERMNMALALLPVDSSKVEYIYQGLLDAAPNDFSVLRNVLNPCKDKLLERLWTVAEQGDRGHEGQRLRAVAALAAYDPDSPRWAKVWPVFQNSPDDSARSLLLHWGPALNVDPQLIADRLAVETDAGARSALMLMLGEYPDFGLKDGQRQKFSENLLTIFENDPDRQMHAAAQWLLQKWGGDSRISAAVARLAKDEKERRRDHVYDHQSWYVNRESQTFVVIDADKPFQMGSPESEPERAVDEKQHLRTIGRRFAIAASQVTVEQFARFVKERPERGPISPQYVRSEDSPQNGVTWYEAAEYCNWLSEKDGMPEDQWCYEPNQQARFASGMRAKVDYLAKTGYRLPTEAEWEFACRAGTTTRFYFGEDEALLGDYAWYKTNSENFIHPAARLKPNNFGLFDMHGNVWGWCECPKSDYPEPGPSVKDDRGSNAPVTDDQHGALRGGAFNNLPRNVRAASRFNENPSGRDPEIGFRPARTIIRNDK